MYGGLHPGVLACALSVSACGGGTPPSETPDAPTPPPVPAPSAATGGPPPSPLALAPPPSASSRGPERLEKGWLGVELAPPSTTSGATISGVFPGSPASEAGLVVGDVVVSVDEAPIAEPRDLSRAIGSFRAGDRISVAYVREGARQTTELELQGMPRGDALTRLALLDQPAPEWTSLERVKGGEAVTLDAYRGKVVVLEFLASWCAACQALTPTVNRWNERYGDAGLEVIGVVPEPGPQASRVAGRFGIQYQVAADATGQTARAYRAYAVPTLLLLDREGVVREVVVGLDRVGIRRFEERMRALLGES